MEQLKPDHELDQLMITTRGRRWVPPEYRLHERDWLAWCQRARVEPPYDPMRQAWEMGMKGWKL